jgi:hypothetical protein
MESQQVEKILRRYVLAMMLIVVGIATAVVNN